MPRVVHFDITADDPERASKFYTDVFGWRIEKSAQEMTGFLAVIRLR